MVQIPGAEDDAALVAAVGIDGVERRARILIERALKVGAETGAKPNTLFELMLHKKTHGQSCSTSCHTWQVNHPS